MEINSVVLAKEWKRLGESLRLVADDARMHSKRERNRADAIRTGLAWWAELDAGDGNPASRWTTFTQGICQRWAASPPCSGYREGLAVVLSQHLGTNEQVLNSLTLSIRLRAMPREEGIESVPREPRYDGLTPDRDQEDPLAEDVSEGLERRHSGTDQCYEV